jgi:beta-1,4-mannosyl-glycoprotein beta-1,4-N-acetylglucosaminyltransferase
MCGTELLYDMAIIDVCTYNGEKDILQLRLGMLYKSVDQFIICESRTTFSGNTKPLYYEQQEFIFRPYEKKIKYYIIDENDDALWHLATESPNTKGAAHWKREFVQKESIKKALQHLKDDDFVYICDVDEIWDASIPQYIPLGRMKLRVYAYYLDNASSEAFWGILRGQWKNLKDICLNHARSDFSLNEPEYGGWHFTSMGGFKEVQRKLNDSYTTESYNTYEIQEKLAERVRYGKDYLGRHFKFKIDTSDWPQYLKSNRQKFAHLCKSYSVQPDSLRGAYG